MGADRSLYEKVILDHNKNPRNYGKLEDADLKAEGFNPLCGDHFWVYIKCTGEIIDELHFEGAGCAISKSSASLMTTLLKGKSKDEARALFKKFHEMVTMEPTAPVDQQEYGKLMVFSGVREYPVRIKCATLAWHTMLSALKGQTDPTSTE